MLGLEADKLLLADEIEGERQDSGEHRNEGSQTGAGCSHGPPGAPTGDQHRRQNRIEADGQRLHEHAGFHDAGGSQGRAHRHKRELQPEGRDEPQHILRGRLDGLLIGAQPTAIGHAQQDPAAEHQRSGKEREHTRLIEDGLSIGLIAPPGCLCNQAGRADAQHLRQGQNHHHQIACQANAGNGGSAEAGDKVEVDEKVQGLQQHAHRQERGELKQVARDGALGKIFHG